jgi:membrane protein required for colicin V production
MLIDVIFIILIVMAIFKGLRRGFIIAIFSVLALIIGLAAAVKLSAVTAVYLKDSVHVSSKWLPILAFVLVFIVVVLLVRWTASLIAAATNFALLGWLNKMGGVLLYVAVYTGIFSVLLFYGSRAHIISANEIAASKTYSIIQPWGPGLINALGSLVPFFKNMFAELEAFFGHVSENIKK